jgi:CheY-like chemotaxis protein
VSNETRRTVLVVDDEADVRQFLRAALLEAGFEVITAADGFEALEQVKRQIPDLISLDLVMPRKSGAKFYHELTHEKKWSKIPVIIVTGHAQDDLGKADLRELTMSGPGVYLEKPVRPDNYIAAVRRILGLDDAAGPQGDANISKLQSEVHDLIATADAQLLEKLKDFLKSGEKS